MDLVELQFNEVSAVLVAGDPQATQAAAARLQQLAIEMLDFSERAVERMGVSRLQALRLQALAHGLPTLREGLLRRAAYVNNALQVVLPGVAKHTYADQGKYASGFRPSGELKVLCA
jgi:hypothetical protein